MLKFAAAFAIMLFSAPLFADVIVFLSGEELEATILERDDEKLKVEVSYGTMLVPLEKVRRIDVDTPEKIEQRALKRAEEKEETDRMRAEGKVRYKGEWVDEEVKKTAESKIAEARKKKREAEEAARKKAEEAEKTRKAEQLKAQQAAQLAAQQQYNNSNNYDNGSTTGRQRRSRNDNQNQYDQQNNSNYNYNNNSVNTGGMNQNYNNNSTNRRGR